ncbi:hypothetical protein MLD38_013826 [Melastoma candidum]|uniref:Uncharacterized protein n=1 Tax=Melastoma candidum TaxID=119954 RepID=A0ACB9RDY6_9MYRT|nr:hypothetical protein MLD38_013826 [Melastoma candidum]
MDRISQLPEPLIHTILSLLPTPDAVRTRVLSRSWLSVCDSFPFWDFKFELCGDAGVRCLDVAWDTYFPGPPRVSRGSEMKHLEGCEDARMGFLDFVLRSLQRDETCIPRVELTVSYSSRICPSLNLFLDLVLDRQVRDLTLSFIQPLSFLRQFNMPVSKFASSSLTVLVLQTCQIDEFVVENGFRNHTLRRLSLSQVTVSKEVLRLLFDCFQFLEDVRIDCTPLYPQSISGLPELKVLQLDFFDLGPEVDAPSLRRLYFHYFGRDEDILMKLVAKFPLAEDFVLVNINFCRLTQLRIPGFLNVDRLNWDGGRKFDVSWKSYVRYFRSPCSPMGPSSTNLILKDCSGLKEVEASECFPVPGHPTSKFSLLEKLVITNCCALEVIQISSPGLKSFCIDDCPNLGDIRIEAPQLQSLKYVIHRSPLVFSVDAPLLSEFVLKLSDKACVDDSLFLGLNSLLSRLDQTTEIEISIQANKWLGLETVNIPELSRRCASPSRNLDHLRIVAGRRQRCENILSLVDALLWSCRPRNLWIPTSSYKQLAKVLYKRVTGHNLWKVELKTVAFSSEFGKSRWSFDTEQDQLWRPETFYGWLRKFDVVEAHFNLQWRDTAGPYRS